MTRTKRDNAEFEAEMKRIALEFCAFRQANNLSQVLLAEIIGVSRRGLQNIEKGQTIPWKSTMEKFNKLRDQYEKEGKPTGRKKTKAA